MKLPALYNVTLHQLSDFQYMDQGVLRLSRKSDLLHLEMKLAELGEFNAYVGLTKLDFCGANGLCALDIQSDAHRLRQFEAVTSMVQDELCLSGLTRLQTQSARGRNVVKSCFVVGYALQT